MSIRSATLLASAAMFVIGAPAFAQDDRYASIPVEEAGTYDGEWQGSWEDDETWHGMWNGTYTDLDGRIVEANYRGTFVGDARFVSEDGPALFHDGEHGWREDADAPGHHAMRLRPGPNSGPYSGPRHHPVAANGQPLGYSFAQREAWLADCRTLYRGDNYYFSDRYDDDDRDGDGNGGILGSLLGAVIGGIAGNRIADGERLGGTLIGAGIGGLAGLAIGAAIDAAGSDDDHYDDYDRYAREDVYAAEYCEAYLRRYESSAYSASYGYLMQAQPVMMVQVAAPHHPHGRPAYREIVREEWIDVPAQETARPAQRAIAPRSAPAPQSTKLTPVK